MTDYPAVSYTVCLAHAFTRGIDVQLVRRTRDNSSLTPYEAQRGEVHRHHLVIRLKRRGKYCATVLENFTPSRGASSRAVTGCIRSSSELPLTVPAGTVAKCAGNQSGTETWLRVNSSTSPVGLIMSHTPIRTVYLPLTAVSRGPPACLRLIIRQARA
jgi:hypothetical protein